MSLFASYPKNDLFQLSKARPLTPAFASQERKDSDIKRFYIRTYGCQMNELDSEVMSGILKKRGLEATQDESLADLLIFNTCSIRDLAERKAMGKIGKISHSKKSHQIIGVTGCMANAKKDSLFRKLPAIDFVVGTNNIHELDSVLDEILHTKRQVLKTDGTFFEELNYSEAQRQNSVSSFVSIIRGCDKYCTYCVVPYTRGPEVSRSPQDILDEVRLLVSKGTREITLLGQNVNSYGKDRPDFGMLFHDLLHALDKIQGLERIRFMTSHPVDITLELMHAIRDLPSVCEMVHFPIQAGSDRVLKKMHRLYTKEQYLEKVSLLKSIVPNVALGTDIIVGFPTETDEDFLETVEVMKNVDYHVAFLFTYSERKGTPASRWSDDISDEEKNRRLQILLQLHDEAQARHRQAMLGVELEVLVEQVNSKDSSYVQGRTRCWKNIIFPGTASDIGTLKRVKAHSYTHKTLIAECL
jgi:tRNA-2-methylthio-N6-dimethylallyladenosine synthase